MMPNVSFRQSTFKTMLGSPISKSLVLLAAIAIAGTTMSQAAAPPTPQAQGDRLAWWREAKFGMFIHWGLYAVPAGRWHEKPIPSIGEWIMNNAKIPIPEYEKLATQFNPVKFNADEWVLIAKNAGMKYIVITSKHHDGFAMFHSKASKYNIVDATPFGRDPMKELAEACKKYGLRLCFYYSHAQDWHEPDAVGNTWDFPQEKGRKDPKEGFDNYMDRKALPQVKEILTQYGPIGLIWYDTPFRITEPQSRRFVDIVRKLQPDCLINSRVGFDLGDYGSEGDNKIPGDIRPGDWETPATLNDTWGFKSYDHNWKSIEELTFKLVDIASKGGNYLLNVGPTAEGVIPPPSIERLAAIGRWLKVNGESIYGCGPTPFCDLIHRCTTKPGKIYVHVFEYPLDKKLVIKNLKNKIDKAYLLADPSQQSLKVDERNSGIVVSLPDKGPDAIDNVVVLQIQGSPQVAETKTASTDELRIIPKPTSIERQQGVFTLADKALIRAGTASIPLGPIANLLQDAIEKDTGLNLTVTDTQSVSSATGSITMTVDPSRNELGAEGYELVITPIFASIKAAKPAGVFYGVQTLLQIISPTLAGNGDATRAEKVELPALRIVDKPRFAWRGLMLDCSRTFLPVSFLRKYIDVLSFYKMNVLQLHLTDDQGWRLEISKHPKLTEIGSKFNPAFVGEVNGFYSQAEIKELVEYANARSVTLVPEIEMPGHCLGLLAAYPQLSCREQQYVIAPNMFQSDPLHTKKPHVPHGALCPGNEKTFEVIEDVISEVIELFPSEYIHIAGDECPKGYWKECPKCQARIKAEGLKDEEELQSYFVKRVAKMIQARGRKVFGWDETLEGGLAPDMGMMSWRSFEAGITAAKLGHPVVMASKSHVYFDYCYNRSPASLVYDYEPVPPELTTPEQRSLVLGGQACMWTHLARSEVGIDMSIFPRILALAEVLWTPVDQRQWNDFEKRMKLHETVLKSKKVTCFTPNKGLGLPNITRGQDSRIWVVNTANEIYLRKDDKWERFPGKAMQVTSGPDGTIWSVSTQPTTRGYVLMRWSESEKEWKAIGKDVAGVQISAAPDGALWATTEAYAIWKFANDKWTNVLALAREVSVGIDGTAWILTSDPAPGGYELFSAPPGGRIRRVQPIAAGVHLAASVPEQLWLSRDDGTLYNLANGKYDDRPGRLTAITGTSDGKAWALTNVFDGDKMRVVRWTGRGWTSMGPMP